MLFVSALCLAACSDDPDVAPLKRDTDAVELTYNSGATTQISVRYAGSWSARVECTDGSGAPVNNWFSVSPDNGVGNGRDYQWVTVTAERNPGDKRTGYIYLKPANGEEIKIEVAQADGHFSVNDPVISGTLKSTTESAAMLEIAYDQAFGDEMVVIEATLDGLAAGQSAAGVDLGASVAPVEPTLARELAPEPEAAPAAEAPAADQEQAG